MSACVPTASVAPSVAPTTSPTPTPTLSPAEVAASVRVTAKVTDRTLIATTGTADFGIEEGARLVRVRILDELHLDIRLESDATVALGGPPLVCLVGPYAAPDDAGLEDFCWGDPDLGELLAARFPTDGAGHPTLTAGEPVDLTATIERGDERCDYPPGEWRLEVALEPLVDGTNVEPVDLAPVLLEISPTTDAPIPLVLLGTRYCGIATVVFRDQGEPPVIPPN